jgi:hypothetical protein
MGCGFFIIKMAFGLEATHHAFPFEGPGGFGYDRMLPFFMFIIVKVDHNPVSCPLELMRPRRIREQGGEMPPLAQCMPHRLNSTPLIEYKVIGSGVRLSLRASFVSKVL